MTAHLDQLLRRAAGLAFEAEKLEAKQANGEQIDTSVYVTLCGQHARIKREIREITADVGGGVKRTGPRTLEEVKRDIIRKRAPTLEEVKARYRNSADQPPPRKPSYFPFAEPLAPRTR